MTDRHLESVDTAEQRREDARRRREQLRLFHDVEVHPHVQELGNDPMLRAAVKIGGDFTVSEIPQNGRLYTVSIANADGEIIATAELEAGPPQYKNVKFDGEVVGEERIHALKAQ